MISSFSKTQEQPISFSNLKKSNRIGRYVSDDYKKGQIEVNNSSSQIKSNISKNKTNYRMNMQSNGPKVISNPLDMARSNYLTVQAQRTQNPQHIENRSSDKFKLFKKEKNSGQNEYKFVDSKYRNFEYIQNKIPDNYNSSLQKSTEQIKENPTFNKRTIIRKSGKHENFYIETKKPKRISIKKTQDVEILKPKIVKVSINRKQQRLTTDSKFSKNSKMSFGSHRNIVGAHRNDSQYSGHFTPKKAKYSIITKNYRDSGIKNNAVSDKNKTYSVINIKELPNVDSNEIPQITKNIMSPRNKQNFGEFSLENTPIKRQVRVKNKIPG
jgi:hypothetical protein